MAYRNIPVLGRKDRTQSANVRMKAGETRATITLKLYREIQYDGQDIKWGFQINTTEKRHQWFKLDLDPSQSRATELALTYPDPLAAPPGYDSSAEKYCTDFLEAIVKHTGHVLRHKLPESALRSTPIEYIVRLHMTIIASNRRS